MKLKTAISCIVTSLLFFIPISSAAAAPVEESPVVAPAAESSTNGYLDLYSYGMTYGNEQDKKRVEEEQKNRPPTILPRSSGSLSAQKTKTANIMLEGRKIGQQTIQYKTVVQGGRPQFAYDTVKLSKVGNLDTYYTLTSSRVSFSGDVITVYFDLAYGDFFAQATATFRP